MPDQIHAWQASVPASAVILAAVELHLTPDERVRAGRFRFQRDRDSYVLSRGLLRQLLAAYTGERPERIRFRYGAQGKPRMENSGTPSLRFNVSHSGDMVLLGFAYQEVGVDVERVQDGVDFAGLAKTSFSQKEQNAVLALAPDKRASLFYEYWTCKEACIKADGRGLSVPLDQFGIVASARGPEWREVILANPEVFESSWRIRILDAIPGYAAAVAAAGDRWDVVRMRLEEVNERLEWL